MHHVNKSKESSAAGKQCYITSPAVKVGCSGTCVAPNPPLGKELNVGPWQGTRATGKGGCEHPNDIHTWRNS